jgi:hypothetical protein
VRAPLELAVSDVTRTKILRSVLDISLLARAEALKTKLPKGEVLMGENLCRLAASPLNHIAVFSSPAFCRNVLRHFVNIVIFVILN